jgi:hypothetical protein
VEQQEPAIASECSLKCLPGLEPGQEKSLQQLCVIKLCVCGTDDTKVNLFEGSDCKIPQILKRKLAPVEALVVDDKSCNRSAFVPCLTQHLELYVADLRRLFCASGRYIMMSGPGSLLQTLTPSLSVYQISVEV